MVKEKTFGVVFKDEQTGKKEEYNLDLLAVGDALVRFETIRDLLGHKTIKMTLDYINCPLTPEQRFVEDIIKRG